MKLIKNITLYGLVRKRFNVGRSIIMSDWVHDLFIKNAEIFIKIMEKKWVRAEKEAYALMNIMAKNGVSEGKILDLMCGNGRLAINLAKYGFKIIGIDISQRIIEDAISRAQRYEVSNMVKFYVGDARDLKNILEQEAPFDAVIWAWSSIGFYDENIDRKILREASDLTRSGGLLLIIYTINRDALLKRFSEKAIEEIGDLVIIKRNEFDPFSSKLKMSWDIYQREGKDMKYITETWVELRIYSLHEIIKLIESSGWKFLEAYHDILTGESFRLDSPFNIIAKKL